MHNPFERLPPIREHIIGHRGAASLAPENTRSSFVRAAKAGLSWVEFDTQMCASDEWVVLHDETLDRTTNGTGRVDDVTYEYIKTLSAGDWFDPLFKNEPVPLLSETLTCLQNLNLHPNIEIKSLNGNKRSKIIRFLTELRSVWPSHLPPPLISSFDWEALVLLKSLDPLLPLGYIVEEFATTEIQKVLNAGFNTLHCSHHKLTLDDISKANQASLPLLVYTVNDVHQIQQLLQKGVTAVFSDLTYRA